MKIRYCLHFAFLLIICFATTALAVDHVDIGNPDSESGHNMQSWGPIEPATSSGSYGGIDHCRATWSTLDGTTNATIDLDFGDGMNVQVAFKHLEGLADDSFKVYLDGVLQYTHNETMTSEHWFDSGFSVSVTPGIHTLEFDATGPQWSQWTAYGQLCIAEISVGMSIVADEAGTWGGVKSLFR